jgi:hypothetical protein
MKNQLNALLLTAALAGLTGGTTVAAQSTNSAANHSAKFTRAGLSFGQQTPAPKHSCKGKNDCKGQGGCKSSDNGCNGKNSCKGKGGCATDGSKMPKANFA